VRDERAHDGDAENEHVATPEGKDLVRE
jgi:hypothetical protein